MSVLIIAEHDHRSIKPATLHLLTAARALGQDVHMLVAGHDCAAASAQARTLAGVATVLQVDHPSLAHGLAEPLADAVVALAAGHDALLFPATAAGKNVAPRVAALLDVAQVSDVTRIVSADTFERPIHAGNAVATVQSLDAVKVLTIRMAAFEPEPGTQAPAPVHVQDMDVPASPVQHLGCQMQHSDRPELASARVVVSGGRALASRERFHSTLSPLADRLGAALGASRAAVDAGYAPNDWQVGQTGKIIAPQLYLAAGISGAIQHLAGMKDAKVIVAINNDAEAPIFGIADYGLQADLFEAVPRLTEAL